MIDLRPACHRMAEVVAGIGDDRIDGPTPCSEYTVAGVVQHVDAVSQGFAALARAAAGAAPDTGGEPVVVDFGEGWRDTVAAHVRDLGAAWRDEEAWRGSSSAGGLELSNGLWGRIALTEMVVHGWDLAQAADRPFELPEETLRACLDHVTDFVPRAPVPGLWGPPVEVARDAPLIDRVVAITGRTP
jgi:uncharacterized protein (TIGR03086 family)